MVSKKQQNLKINYNFCLTIIMIKQTKRLFFTLRNILFKNKERFYIIRRSVHAHLIFELEFSNKDEKKTDTALLNTSTFEQIHSKICLKLSICEHCIIIYVEAMFYLVKRISFLSSCKILLNCN